MSEENLKATGEDKPEGFAPQPVTPPQPPKPGFGTRMMKFFFTKETRLGRFNRTLVRGVAFFIGVFAIGFFVAYFALYKPSTLNAQKLTDSLSEANQQAADLSNEVAALQGQIKTLENDKTKLGSELKKQQGHTQLLSALADVQMARLALAGNNASLAKATLKDTATRLQVLEAYLKTTGSADGALLLSRLDLALKEIDSSDLSLAAKDLLTLADTLKQVEMQYFPL